MDYVHLAPQYLSGNCRDRDTVFASIARFSFDSVNGCGAGNTTLASERTEQ